MNSSELNPEVKFHIKRLAFPGTIILSKLRPEYIQKLAVVQDPPEIIQ